jgi:hypothetical protein
VKTVRVNQPGSNLVGKLAITIPPGLRQEISLDLSPGVDTGFLAALFDRLGRAASQSASGVQVPQFPNILGGAINLISRGVDPVIALAPIRTKPRRTYDELSDAFTPEGDHIPILLARLWEQENSKEKERLSEALECYLRRVVHCIVFRRTDGEVLIFSDGRVAMRTGNNGKGSRSPEQVAAPPLSYQRVAMGKNTVWNALMDPSYG